MSAGFRLDRALAPVCDADYLRAFPLRAKDSVLRAHAGLFPIEDGSWIGHGSLLGDRRCRAHIRRSLPAYVDAGAAGHRKDALHVLPPLTSCVRQGSRLPPATAGVSPLLLRRPAYFL